MPTLQLVKKLSRETVMKTMVFLLDHRSMDNDVAARELRDELRCRSMADNPIVVLRGVGDGRVHVMVKATYVGDFSFIAEGKSGDHDGDY